MLHNIYLRYCASEVYTAVGSVLLSVNPFTAMPDLYSSARMALYRGAEAAGAGPHIYGTTEAAYSELLATGRNQALIMSGESGAGKTEACKIAMGYLAAASEGAATATAASEGGDGASVARRISQCLLDSNVVLEALGNAKTFRNNNSSRFGKWVALHVSPGGQICGGRLTTYLLETVRVTRQLAGERNYRFYQLLAAARDGQLRRELSSSSPASTAAGGAGADLAREWGLAVPAAHFAYLQSSDVDGVSAASDAAGFGALCKGLRTLGVSDEGLADLFRLLAALLQLGNVRFAASDRSDDGFEGCRVVISSFERGAGGDGGGSGAAVDVGDAPPTASPGPAAATAETQLEATARLLRVESACLEGALTTRRVVMQRHEAAYSIPLQVAEAVDARDALTVTIYGLRG